MTKHKKQVVINLPSALRCKRGGKRSPASTVDTVNPGFSRIQLKTTSKHKIFEAFNKNASLENIVAMGGRIQPVSYLNPCMCNSREC